MQPDDRGYNLPPLPTPRMLAVSLSHVGFRRRGDMGGGSSRPDEPYLALLLLY